MYSVVKYVCNHRNARKRSSGNHSQPTDGVYETPNPTGRDNQPQYDVIQLGQIQPGPDADHYHSLNPQTQGLQPPYDVISRPQRDKDAPDYVNYMM